MEDRSFYVYLHIRLDNNTTFYVGKGKGNRDLIINRNKHHDNIIKRLRECNEDYAVVRILDNLTEDESLFYEKEIIEYLVFDCGYGIDIDGFKDRVKHGQPYLTNCSWGGEGTSGYKHTKKTKQKMSNAKKGTRLAEETKQKIGESNKGKTLFEETKNKISKANKGKKRSEVTKRKIGEASRGRHHSEETKQKQRDASNEYWKDPEAHKIASENMSGKYNPMHNKNHKKESIIKNIISNMKAFGTNHIECIETGEIFINAKNAWKKYGGSPELVADGKRNSTGRRGQEQYTYKWIPVGSIPIENLIII